MVLPTGILFSLTTHYAHARRAQVLDLTHQGLLGFFDDRNESVDIAAVANTAVVPAAVIVAPFLHSAGLVVGKKSVT